MAQAESPFGDNHPRSLRSCSDVFFYFVYSLSLALCSAIPFVQNNNWGLWCPLLCHPPLVQGPAEWADPASVMLQECLESLWSVSREHFPVAWPRSKNIFLYLETKLEPFLHSGPSMLKLCLFSQSIYGTFMEAEWGKELWQVAPLKPCHAHRGDKGQLMFACSSALLCKVKYLRYSDDGKCKWYN